MARRYILPFSALLLLASACGGSPPPSTVPGENGPTTADGKPAGTGTTPTNDGPASASDPTVTLVSQGQDPKGLLRFHVAKGSTQGIVMTMTMGMGRDGQTMTLPPMKMSMNLTVTDVMPDGRMRYDYKMEKFELGAEAGPLAEKLKDAFKGIENMSGHVVVTDRGFVRDADVQMPSGASPQMQQITESLKQSMGETHAPFPAEAVGVGAKWDVAKTVSHRGITLQQVAHYELLSRTGDTGKMRVTVTQNADPQQVNSPGMPPGAKVELTSLKSDGDGSIDFDLTKLSPVDSTSRLSTTMGMNVTAAGGTQAMSMKMDIDVRLQGK